MVCAPITFPRTPIVRAFEYKLAARRRVDPERKCDRFKVRHAADLWTSLVLQHPLSPRFTSTNKATSRARMSIYEAGESVLLRANSIPVAPSTDLGTIRLLFRWLFANRAQRSHHQARISAERSHALHVLSGTARLFHGLSVDLDVEGLDVSESTIDDLLLHLRLSDRNRRPSFIRPIWWSAERNENLKS